MNQPIPTGSTVYQKLVKHDAHRDRNLGIGSSDANRIAKGDWLDLYREKIGEQEPADLSGFFRVQLGVCSEPLHRRWHSQQTKTTILNDGYPQALKPNSVRFATVDGWVVGDDIPIEFKHTNERNDLRSAATYYMPQLQHIMLVTTVERIRFSIIRGNQEPEWGYVAADAAFQDTLVKMEDQFWWHVTNRVPPMGDAEGGEELGKLAQQVAINGYKPYDYTTNNLFNDLALTYVTHKDAATRFETAKKELKELVPADASEVTCKHLVIKRTGSGLRFKEPS